MATSAFAAGAYAAAQSIARPGSAPKPMQASGAGGGFGSLLTQALDTVAQTGAKADAQTLSAATGKANVIDVVTAVAESETALQTLVAVRDRVISAYEEIMRMPI
ncbi:MULTISPECIES: flagellar hook-basal body complex protein FliE [Methylobacterium]|uniref:Flagellar hook-basal body complex protein FliE n=1 Tax=Methylobacterium thuringiense TaxID=1003091 RepID=A0ABQ4TM98_9HYPH|nr:MULTISPECIES: flagellar hook-basal body complex protein FliE [Methylobacterium]TXN23728.1 flagellar hook-basal body complex protein FliE [Methylobacterium sp. WL9]GJE56126.1 Flagellar hook-basal body complex protein FliE [Methylobacterium thuringiense]